MLREEERENRHRLERMREKKEAKEIKEMPREKESDSELLVLTTKKQGSKIL